MANTIQVRRGANASLPTLSAGELGFSTDTHQTYIGDGAANHELASVDLPQTITNKKYEIDIPADDHTAEGVIINDTVGENVAIGDALYMKSDGKWWKCDADAAATMPCQALAIASITADASGELLLYGLLRDDTWTWTIGGYLYPSVTPGNPSQTAPSGAGDQVQRIGIALTADVIYFNPDLTIIEVAA